MFHKMIAIEVLDADVGSIEVPGTIDHHTVVYEYLDGRKLMSLKQGSPEFFFGEATTSKFQNS